MVTRPARIAGVLLVAALTVAVPALGSAHGAAHHPTKGSALLCPVATAAAGAPVIGAARSAPATKLTAQSPRGRRGRHPHRRGVPCIPPCRWLTPEPGGATGPTGPRHCKPPPVCRLAAAGPQPICWCVAEGETGDTTGPTGATPPCPPCPLATSGVPGTASGVTGPTGICRPLPCPVPSSTPSGATTPAIVCPQPPICPLSSSVVHSSVCLPPCVVADPVGATTPVPLCPRIPSCPPPPAQAVAPAHAALYACPEVPAAAARTG